MNGYNFTERVRKVLAMAREEAARLHHEYVGTEHILLGLVREEHGAAAQVITSFGITIDAARAGVLEILGSESQAYQEFKRRRTFGVGREMAREMARTPTPSWMMARQGPPMAGSRSMAAAVLEALMQDAGVADVFAAQRIDARTLIAALRAASFRPPPGEASGESAGDSPSEPLA